MTIDNNNRPGRRIRFTGEINIGHVLVAASMLTGSLMWIQSSGAHQERINARIAANERCITELSANQKTITYAAHQTEIAVTRLTTIVEQMHKNAP